MPARPTRGVSPTNGRGVTRGDVMESIASLRNELVGDNSLKTNIEYRLNEIHERLGDYDRRIQRLDTTLDAHLVDYNKQKGIIKGWAAGISIAASTLFKFLFPH